MKNSKLEFIRGIAALMVFFCHSAINFHQFKTNALYNNLVNWGTESVIIFFILSGIVIQISQKNNPKSASEFMLNRLKRLYPLYLIGLLLAFSFVPWDYKIVSGNLLFLGSLQSFIVPVPRFNPALWSLSFEMFFYCMYALYIKLNYNKIFIGGWLVLCALCIPLYYLHFSGIAGHFICMFAFSSIWLLGYYTASHISRFPSVTLPQAFFLFGLLFLCARIEYTKELYCVIRYTIFSLVALPIFAYCLQTRQTKESNVLKWPYIIALYIVLLAGIRFFSSSLPSSKLIYSFAPLVFAGGSFLLTAGMKSILLKAGVFLGFISYSLYIIHYPIQYFISLHTGNLNGFVVLSAALLLIIPLAYSLEILSKRIFSRSKRQPVRLKLES